jgi:hypothetical protein
MSELRHAEGQMPSAQTHMELNPLQLLTRIHAAEAAIFLCLQEMRTRTDVLVDGQVVQDALDGLLDLTKETVKFTDSMTEMARTSGRAWA